MNTIHSTLLKAWLVSEKGEIDPETRQLLADAIIRAEAIFPALTQVVNRHTTAVMKAQPFNWLGGLNEGRWLSREADIYDKESNSNYGIGHTPETHYTR